MCIYLYAIHRVVFVVYSRRPLYLFANNVLCDVCIHYNAYMPVTQTTRYMCYTRVCVCVCVRFVSVYVYSRYLCARAIRVPAGCAARGGGGRGDGDGAARRRVNEMFSRGWLRHGVVIYKNVITLSERRRCSVFPPGWRAPR